MNAWMVMSLSEKHRNKREGWREDDEAHLGCFELEVSLGHPGREDQLVRALSWRYNVWKWS